jgi:hypothetical protein
MKLVRSSLFLATVTLTTSVTIVAQGPPPQPAGGGITMAKTWTDADLDRLMKEIGGTVGALRKAIDGQNAELLKTNADKIEELFEDATSTTPPTLPTTPRSMRSTSKMPQTPRTSPRPRSI